MTASTPLTEQLPQVLRDLTDERARQISKGWTPEHDDAHSTASLVRLAGDRLAAVDEEDAEAQLEDVRRYLVEATAILVATIEALDREAR